MTHKQNMCKKCVVNFYRIPGGFTGKKTAAYRELKVTYNYEKAEAALEVSLSARPRFPTLGSFRKGLPTQDKKRQLSMEKGESPGCLSCRGGKIGQQGKGNNGV